MTLLKTGKWILIIMASLIVIAGSLYAIYNEALPDGEHGPAAEALADKMLTAINKQAYDSTAIISWRSFRGNHFIWDKKRNLVEVSWDQYSVLLDLSDISGVAFKNGRQVEDDKLLLQQAWKSFANDSFWLVAPFKVRDPGTTRRLIHMSEGPGLLVTYSSGGVTPGDSYLWILDHTGKPVAWKIWASIIPIGGLEFSWEQWKNFPNGLILSTKHQGIIDLAITDVTITSSVESLTGQDRFAPLFLKK